MGILSHTFIEMLCRMNVTLLLTLLVLLWVETECGILDPRHARRRERVSLDGLWKFSLGDDSLTDYTLDGDDQDAELMPVPASYNDITTNHLVRDYVGVAKYQRRFSVPKSWGTKRIWLRFGSVSYAAQVYINGELALSHDIGHLPFAGEVTSLVKADDDNDIVVLVDNTLTSKTIPQGSLHKLDGGRIKQGYNFDFFNYAGIDRPVLLYATENTYIDDITIHTAVNGTTGTITYDIVVEGSTRFTPQVSVLDKEGNEVASSERIALSGNIEIKNANLWWPYLMSDSPGYLYKLKVDLYDNDGNLLDRYELPFGIRDLSWDDSSLKINGKPVYLRGFGHHEDSDIRGKGLDLAVVLRDYSLIKWIGANSYRTTHYPYAEEIMDLADSRGIMIVDEVPAVETDDYSDELLDNHKRSITELINRDKNRPSVIIWSAASAPNTTNNASEDYFRQVIEHLKSSDQTRPVTIANLAAPDKEYSGQFLDILSFNKYAAWTSQAGDLEYVAHDVLKAAKSWHKRHNKPVMVTEYGADTIEGMRLLPSFLWTETFQQELMSSNFEVFDELRAQGWFVGEMICNFADFKTREEHTRVGGNKMGIFTRQRQPKQSAYLMRRRYWTLANLLDNVTAPVDLDYYIAGNPSKIRDEL